MVSNSSDRFKEIISSIPLYSSLFNKYVSLSSIDRKHLLRIHKSVLHSSFIADYMLTNYSIENDIEKWEYRILIDDKQLKQLTNFDKLSQYELVLSLYNRGLYLHLNDMGKVLEYQQINNLYKFEKKKFDILNEIIEIDENIINDWKELLYKWIQIHDKLSKSNRISTKNCLNEEGLFRIAPSQVKQKKFVAELNLQTIDRGTTLNELNYDPHVPASTLKQYLRELPDCLLTTALLPQWNEIISLSSEQARLQRIGQLINKLPEINYQNLCYLVNFLARVAEYSSENKMTPSNLSICIGCSILYGKDQSYSQNQTISNSYTAASIILELMIIHHKQLFNSYYQQEQTSKSFKSQPDIIPTEFHSKSRNDSNENLLDVQNISVYTQPSPGTRRKNKAPRPPPLSSFNQQTSVEQINCENVSSDLNSNDQTSNECLTGN
ncbi:unnamed protein product [Rotaria sordida]|uniref:Rho-GAP domain-containing protein n=1 Tax=Rotaria sordida TaxID=392033 RepID=A0A815INF3_9BILA|nr:unnamed protein product [Rotaria sordida]